MDDSPRTKDAPADTAPDSRRQATLPGAAVAAAGRADNKEFLLHLSFLPRATSTMAAAVSGRRDAEEILARLHQEGLPLQHQAGPVAHYALQDWFRAFLADSAGKHFTEAKILDLLAQSAALLEGAGWIDEAFSVLAARQRWQEAGALLGRHASALLAAGARSLLVRWIRALPPEHAAHPDRQYWLAQALPDHEIAAKLQAYEHAFGSYERSDRRVEMIACLSEMCILVCLSELAGSRTSAWLKRLHVLVREQDRALPHAIRLTALSALTRGMHFSEFADYDVLRWAVRLAKLLAATEAGEARIKGATTLLRFYVHFGFPARAQHLIAQYGMAVEEHSIAPITKVWWYIACGQHYFVNGKRQVAHDMLGRSEHAARAAGLVYLYPNILIHQLYICLGAGDLAGAAALIAQLEPMMQPGSVVERVFFHGGLAWQALLRKKPADALPHAQAVHALAADLIMPVAHGFAALALTSTLIACGDIAQAQPLLKHLQDNEMMSRSDFFAPHVRLLGARLARLLGNQEVATERLRSAFLLAKETQALSPVFWLPDAMAELCEDALARNVEVDFVQSLIKTKNLVPHSRDVAGAWPWPLRIHVLGSFSIFRDGEELLFSGKAQRKPLEFLKAMIALGGQGVDAFILTHLLWPDAESEAAQRSFHSTLHRLRKLLGSEETILLAERKVSLNSASCWVDLWEFDHLVNQSRLQDAAIHAGPDGGQVLIERVLALYRSDFLVLDEMQPWIMPTRERLRAKFLHFICSVSEQLEQAGRSEQAIALYQRGLEVDCLAEDIYRRLMECRHRRGELAEAFGVYRRCREMLSIVLGVPPSEKTNALYREMLSRS